MKTTCIVLVGLLVAAALFDTAQGRANPTINKGLCESCFQGGQCKSGVCVGRKCVKSTSRRDVNRCNRKLCAPCSTRLVCKSNRCYEGKCIRFGSNGPASIRKCFPKRLD